MHVTGSCHCGQITFDADIDPQRVRVCHCRDCQKLSGTAFRVTAPVAEANVRWSGRQPSLYVKTSEAGNQRVHAFCGNCGAPIYATSPAGDNRQFGLRVGLIDQRDELVPHRQFWHRSRLPWLPELPGSCVETQ